MASSQDGGLKTKLLDLESRFTWELRKDDIDIESRFTWELREDDIDIAYLQSRLQDKIKPGLGTHAEVTRSYSSLAYVRYLQGYPEEALEHLLKAEHLTREKHGEDCEKLLMVTYGDLSWLHYHIGDHTKSQGYLDKLERIRDKFPLGSGSTSLHPEVYGEKGWTFLKFSPAYYPQALECFQKALELDPEEREWNTGYAIALHRTENEFSSSQTSPAIKQLRRALEINPEDGELLPLLAIRLGLNSEFTEAEELVEKALTMYPDSPHVTQNVGKYFMQRGHLDCSIGLLKGALDRNIQSAFIHQQLARCYKKKMIEVLQQGRFHGKEDEAKRLRHLCIHHLEKAISLKFSFFYATVHLALDYGEDGDHAKAEEMFQTIMEMAKDQPVKAVQQAHLYYGQFQQYQAKCESKAIEHYTEGLQLDKDSGYGKQCARKLWRIAEGRIAKDPRDGVACGLLGLVYQMQGERNQAVHWYEKALVYDKENEKYLSALCELRLVLQ